MAPPARLIPLFGPGRRGHSSFDIDIINLSLGHPIFESAAAPGIFVISTAGHFGTNPKTGDIRYAGTTSPGNAPSAIAVGAYVHKAAASRLDDRSAADDSRGRSDTETNWTPTLPPRPGVQSRETGATLTCSISIDGRQFASARNMAWDDRCAWNNRVCDKIVSKKIVWEKFVWDNTVHYNQPIWTLPRPQEPDGTRPAASIVWGDNIVWADQPALNWDNIVWGNTIRLGQNIVWGDNPVRRQSLDDDSARGSWNDIVWGNDDNFIWPQGAVAFDANHGRAQR